MRTWRWRGKLARRRTCLDSARPTEAILEFAREHRITQIFVGHSARSRWQNLVGGSPLDRLIEATEDMDLRIFPHSQSR